MKVQMLVKFSAIVFIIFQVHNIECRRVGLMKRYTATVPPADEASDETDESPEADDDSRIYKNPRNSPSALCPRDEEQATLLGQKCLRKCSSDEDCKSKKKKCLCDGVCGMSCIKPERECEEVKDPDLGAVSATGRLFGDRASYTCEAGYHVVGLQERTCQADGSWSGQAPVCRKNIYCTSPPVINNARHNALPEQTTFDLDSTLHYQCYMGYVTSGFPKAKCLAIEGSAQWFGPDITCEPRSCGLPDDIPNGFHAGECHTYGCRVTYHCAEGFELTGRGERFCQADGTWTPKELPACVLVTAVQCPPPDNPGNGKAIFTSCSFNSVVSYECKYGYTLVGEPTRRCGADRRWTGSQPKCQEINCGHPGLLYNGWIENLESGTGLGASIIFRCHEGMKLEGNTSSVCQIDGRWRYPLPKCLAPCVVPGVKQGRVLLLTANGEREAAVAAVGTTAAAGREPIKELPMVVAHGEKLAVECEPRYEFPGNGTPVVCNNGTWTHIPRCEPARCKRMPRAPRNGMVIAPKTEHGMRARFKCKDGYTLRGPNVTECSYGNWTSDIPYCQEVYCPFPGYIENGRVMLVGNMGVYDYRPYVRKVTNNKQIMYECERGYVLADGPPGATCLGGRWSPKQLPRCVPGMHPRIRWSRSVRSVRSLREALLAAARRSNLLAPRGSSDASAAADGKVPVLVRRKRGGMRVSSGASTSSRTQLMRGSKNNNNDGSRGSRGRKPKRPPDEQRRPGHRGGKGVKGAPCEVLADEPTMKVEIVKAGRDPNQTYSPGTVVRITCSKGYSLSLGRHSNNTAKCARGQWKPAKPECLIQNDDYPEGMVRTNGTCLYRNSEPNLVSFYNDQQITEEVVEFPPGSLVVSRCVDIGKYAMIGSNRRRCVAGEWDGQKPVCFGLNQENDYALEKPPTILFRHQLGPIAQSNDGRLVVYPGTILHMECLWIRRFGTPKWVVSHSYRKYPEGWTTDPGRDSQLEYRLSIYHAGRDDSGTFTCMTPTRHTHAVEIIVKAVHCPNIPPRRGLNLSSMNTKMNTKITLSCANGNSLIGASEITCLPSGNWSAPIPICESIECADLLNLTDPHLRVSILSREVGGRAVFSCAQGYGLRGPHEAICLHTGDWATPLPSCEEVQCNSPGVPENGYIQGNGPYKAGDVIQFNCNPDYMMEGQPIIACQENGRWSGTIPKCVQACSYPGTTISGRMSTVKFYYKIGETITFTCDEGLELRGAPMLRCLRNGKWSNAIPTCVASNR